MKGVAKKQNGLTLWQNMKMNREAYFMLLPFFILFSIFTIIPVCISLPIGFTNFNMAQFPQWVGLSNFFTLFLQDDVFLKAIQNTLLLALITGPLSYFLCLLLAWLISQMSRFWRTFLTFIFYAPSISGGIFFVWLIIFSGDQYGFANGILRSIGLITGPKQWLTDEKYTMLVVIIVQIWISLGAGFLAFIAGLQNVDRALYECGAVEGIRNRWQELMYITLPALGPQLMFGAVMQITSSFTAAYVATALTGLPSTNYSTHTVMAAAQDYGSIRYEMGYASAICFFLFAVMLILNGVIRKILNKYLDV